VALVTDCIGTTFDGAKCAQEQAAYPACTACLFTPYTSSSFGPFIGYGDLLSINVAECIVLRGGDSSDGGCAASLGLNQTCVEDSCLGCTHPLPEGGIAVADGGNAKVDLPNWLACAAAAASDGGPCAAFTDTVQNVCLSPAFLGCAQGGKESQPAYLQRMGGYFCGGSLDAGSDAATDAPAD
jgi:hypothetical protein